MVMVWWEGMQCETHKEDLSGGEQGTKKTHCFEKTIYPAKKPAKKKKKKSSAWSSRKSTQLPLGDRSEGQPLNHEYVPILASYC